MKKRKSKLKRIGILAEDTNDFKALRNLLRQKYSDVKFVELAKRLTGSKVLNTNRLARTLDIEAEEVEFIIFLIDLDDFESNSGAVANRETWFQEAKRHTNDLFLLAVQELEAWLLYDVEVVNFKYGTTLSYSGDPERRQKPKEYLISQTRQGRNGFTESDNPDLFSRLSYDKLRDGCKRFRQFDTNLVRQLP